MRATRCALAWLLLCAVSAAGCRGKAEPISADFWRQNQAKALPKRLLGDVVKVEVAASERAGVSVDGRGFASSQEAARYLRTRADKKLRDGIVLIGTFKMAMAAEEQVVAEFCALAQEKDIDLFREVPVNKSAAEEMVWWLVRSRRSRYANIKVKEE